jgi:type IV pilus assembly protein PilO
MTRSPQERLWLIGGAVGAFLLLVIGYFLVISPQRSNTQSVRDQITTAQEQAMTLQQRITALTSQSKDLPKYKSQLAVLQEALPATSGLPDFLRTLQSLGNETLAQVTSLTVGPPSVVAAGAAPVASPSATGATPTEAAPTETTAPTTTTTTTPPTSSAAGVYVLSITAQVTGSTNQLGDFLDQLQTVQPRAVLVTSVTVGGGSSSSARTAAPTSMSLTMQAFVAPSLSAETSAPTTSATP